MTHSSTLMQIQTQRQMRTLPAPQRPAKSQAKRVAFVISLPFVVLREGRMAISSSLAVLAAAVRRAQTRSAHGDDYELVALVMKKDEAACRPTLEGLGYRVVPGAMPVKVNS